LETLNNNKRNIAIVGLGLLGASLAAAIKRSSLGQTVGILGVSSQQACDEALRQNIIDDSCHYKELAERIDECELVFLCTPVSHISQFLKEINQNSQASHPVLFTDVGSTKEELCSLAAKHLKAPFYFIGGHPMAGSEKNGIQARDAALYENAYWILCPEAENYPHEVMELLKEIIREAGSTLVYLAPKEHDEIMAHLSHAPQMIATALSASIPEPIVSNNYLHLAGRGFRDSTRIAASSYSMWKDIFRTNPSAIRHALHHFQDKLTQLDQALSELETKDYNIHEEALSRLENIFSRGVDTRTLLSSPGRGFAQGLAEVLVQIDDNPGMIEQVVTPLSQAGINILDIELLKVREGVDGTLLLAFRTPDKAQEACELLAHHGFSARMR
jgi:prephenate dehydrogenase